MLQLLDKDEEYTMKESRTEEVFGADLSYILDVDISISAVDEDFIPRIAEKITFTDGPTGDIPNIQVDGFLASHSEIVEVNGDMNISFHTMSLPSSRRVWHCPIIGLFTSDDGEIGGAHFKELAFIRLDGEVWCDTSKTQNDSSLTKCDDFENWSI